MIFNDRMIEEQRHMIEPFNSNHLQPASYDLTMGIGMKLFSTSRTIRIFDLMYDDPEPLMENTSVYLADKGKPRGYYLEGKTFALITTAERIILPENVAGRIEGKSSLARLGLFIHITAGFVDPGFDGEITLEVFNANDFPVILREGMLIAQICFMECYPALLPYEGKYQYQSGPQPSKYYKNYV